MICENNDELHNRILSRKPAYEPKDYEIDALRRHFESTSDSLAAYLFYDGHIEDAEAYRKRLINRTAQLVSTATDGFPVLISRGRIMGFKSCPLCHPTRIECHSVDRDRPRKGSAKAGVRVDPDIAQNDGE